MFKYFQEKLLIEADSPESWRSWLSKNYFLKDGIWLRIFRKNGEIHSVQYGEAVDEALCFGWIDSSIRKYDELSYVQYFSPRNPKSNWSKVNKDKVKLLIKQGKMTEHGSKLIEIAKKNGSWNALDEVEKLIIPKDLEIQFKKYPNSKENFLNFSRSTKRGILEWIFNARREETREKRLEETAKSALNNLVPNQFRRK